LFSVVSTITFIEDCSKPIQYDISPSASIKATKQNCTTSPNSNKVFTQQFVSSGSISPSDYYLKTDIIYSLALQITKGAYFKDIQQHEYYDPGFIAVWIVLFGIGNLAILQILKGLFDSVIALPKRLKNAPNHLHQIFFGDIPEGDEEEEEGEKTGKDEVEMKSREE